MKINQLLLTAAFICILCSVNAQSPSWIWAKSAGGGTYSDRGRSVATDSYGNSFVTGSFNDPSITFGNITLPNLSGGNNSDLFIVKYDPSGNVLWAKSAGGGSDEEGLSIVADATGNSYITGFFSSNSITFGSITLTKTGPTNIFIVKFDPDGNVTWAKSAEGTGHDYGNCIALDAQSNIFLTGYFNSSILSFDTIILTNSSGYNRLFIAKYDSSGHALMANSIGSAGTYGNAIVIDANQNLFLTGTFSGSMITFGSITLYNPEGQDVFIVKFDSSGNVLWAKSGGGNGYDEVRSIAVDNVGNSYITGGFNSNIMNFDGTTLTNAGWIDVFVAKYDPSGNLLWVKSAGGANDDISNSICVDANGNSYITGSFYFSDITFGSITLINAGIANIFIVSYDPSGNVVSANSIGGNSEDIGYCITRDITGNAYLTGCYDSQSIAFGSIILTNTIIPNVFTAKMSFVTAVEGQNNSHSEITVFPNPSTNLLTIVIGDFNKKAELTISDLSGKIIYIATITDSKKIEVNTTNFAEGIYIVQLQSMDFITTKRLIID